MLGQPVTATLFAIVKFASYVAEIRRYRSAGETSVLRMSHASRRAYYLCDLC